MRTVMRNRHKGLRNEKERATSEGESLKQNLKFLKVALLAVLLATAEAALVVGHGTATLLTARLHRECCRRRNFGAVRIIFN